MSAEGNRQDIQTPKSKAKIFKNLDIQKDSSGSRKNKVKINGLFELNKELLDDNDNENSMSYIVATIDSNCKNSVCLWDLYSQKKISLVSTSSSLEIKITTDHKKENEVESNDVTSFVKGGKGRVLVGCKEGSLKLVEYSTDNKI